MKIVADDKIPFLKGVLEPFVDIEYLPGSKMSRKDVEDADGLIIRTRTRCNAKLLENTNVRFIATATIGFDHIDTAYCRARNITWINAPGCNSGSVMQYIASALLTLYREKNIDLTKRVLGIVGAGNVGKKIIRLAENLGMQVVINDPPRVRNEGVCGFLSLEGILREADIISFHVPLIMTGEDKTFHLVDDKLLTKVNEGTYLINSSRGEVVNNKALRNALNDGRIAGAILDVWENEPDIDPLLMEKTFIATPHIAGYSTDGKANGTTMAVRATSKFFNLGIDDWQPEEIPEPQQKIIEYDAKDRSSLQIFSDILLNTYDIRNDDAALRAGLSQFEQLRGGYPIRREFPAFELKAKNLTDDMIKALQRLGFKSLK